MYAAIDEAAYVLEYALQLTLISYPLMILLVSIWIAISFYKGDNLFFALNTAQFADKLYP